MQYKTIRFIICGIFIWMAACAPQPTPTPTLIPPPTDTPLPPTETIVPFTPTPTDIPPELISEIDTWLGNLAKQDLFSGSVLIAQQGKVLLSKGYGLADREQNIPNTAQTRFRLGSITKQFTAMAILILESQGKLNVKDPICNYFADCPATWSAITIHHLLTHTSGIPDFTNLADYRGMRATPSAPVETMARFKDLPLDFQPGEKWSYSNSGYIVLGYIIEQVSGQTYEDFLQQSIFTPLNMHDTGYDHNSNDLAVGYTDPYSSLPADFIDMSIPFAAGALYSTVQDLYLWEQALFTDQLVSQKYLDMMIAPHATIPDSGGWTYGYGLMCGIKNGRSFIGHAGGIEGFSTIIIFYPDDHITMIVLSNTQNKDVGLIWDILSKKIFGEH